MDPSMRKNYEEEHNSFYDVSGKTKIFDDVILSLSSPISLNN